MYSRLVMEATILDGQTTSEAIDTDGRVLEAIQTASTWNTANITFLGSIDGTNYAAVQDHDGTGVLITAAAASELFTDLGNHFRGLRFIKVVSGVAQTGDTTLLLSTVPSG